MLVKLGIVVTMGMVFGGFISHGGNMGVIIGALPTEAMVIGGAAIGSFITGNGGAIMKKAGSGLEKDVKGPSWKKDDYKDVLYHLFMISKLIKTKGVIALEAHIENPHESKIFNHVGRVKDDHHITDFICDYFRMITMNFDDPHQMEDVMLKDLEKHHHEESEGAHSLSVVGDAFPALGIVAAVLGVMKDFIIAHLHGSAPQIASEIARKAVPHDFQPTFYELDEVLQEIPNDVFA